MNTRPQHGASYYTSNIADDSLSREGRIQLEIAAITGASQGAISKILKHSRETGTLNQRARGYREDRKMHEKIGFCWEWGATPLPFKSRLRVKFNCRIGRRISVGNINRRLLTIVFFSQARHMPKTIKRASSALQEALFLLWRVLLQTISQWWSDSSSLAWRVKVSWCMYATNRWQYGIRHLSLWG